MTRKIRKANHSDYPEMMRIWESAVKATHDFLAEADFQYYKELLPSTFFPQVELYLLEDGGQAKGFLGMSGGQMEMLFVDAGSRGKGYGKLLLNYALKNLRITKVDVNEQNRQAIGFYLKQGFRQAGRSDIDAMGKPYPILHLEYPVTGAG